MSTSSDDAKSDNKDITLALAEEKVDVSRETVVERTVTVKRLTSESHERINMTLRQQKVKVTHFPCNKVVEKVPEIREENGVIIIPVVEEEIEVIRRIVLREEVHIAVEEKQIQHEQPVSLRKQYVEIQEDEKR